jgi:hypothetical protein
MIKYLKDKEWPMDVPSEGILVFDIDRKATILTTKEGRRFKKEYPITHKKILVQAADDKLMQGECYVFNENNHKVIIIVVGFSKVGRYADSPEDLVLSTTYAIDSMLSLVETNAEFYSGILAKNSNAWGDIHKYITENKLNWNVMVG